MLAAKNKPVNNEDVEFKLELKSQDVSPTVRGVLGSWLS